MLILTVEGSLAVDRDELQDALAGAFGVVNLREVELPDTAVYDLNLRPADGTPFRVTELTDGSLTIDGTAEQNERVAVIVRAMLPEDHRRVIAFEPHGDQYVDLTPGITAQQIDAGWRHISEGGF